MAKYQLTEDALTVNGRTLYRIIACVDFEDVKAGEMGGYVEKEKNLSQDGNAWVYGNAKVCDNAWVYGNAKVCGNAWVYDYAWVGDNAKVSGNAKVGGNAKVYGNAWVYDNAKVYGNAWVYGKAWVGGNAKVYGTAWVYGNAWVYGDAELSCNADYIVFKDWWSSGRYFTWTRSNNKYKVGCFYGSGEELTQKAYRDSENSGINYGRIVRYVETILNDNQ